MGEGMRTLKKEEYDPLSILRRVDPEIAAAIEGEQQRQQNHLELIASENLAGKAVLQAQGSILTNKYAEGYPGARYYGGCIYVDQVEELARSRARELFGAEHANVQPHAGAPANLAVYLALLKPGDPILGMDRAHGGHLTHGTAVNASGHYYTAHTYGVNRDTGLIDMDEVRSIALSCRPRLIIAGASSYPRVIDYAAFAEIAREVGAVLMVDMAHVAGLVAAGEHPNPVHHAWVVTSTTHKTLRGPRGGLILCRRQFARAVDRAVFPGLQGGPLMHVIAAKAVAFKETQTPEFKIYQQNVKKNAAALAQALLEHDFYLSAGGTDTHMVLVDLRNKGITGAEAEALLDQVGITANKNAVPYDPRGPKITSGLRLGTPAVTSRGMGTAEMVEIARLINDTLVYRDNAAELARIKRRVLEMCDAFPIA